ncbi:MAG: nicotinate-nucleotide--dimethylbenzimidazole phosphoribosyltransferase [Chloroflexota bacterium]|jgi:nicotinate-nucleotide--dimethylbenzimidazole phosphoribosyltransferase|nr:nicotinate-nucleotide--dimethylbenzimidazole phosphoribosyltransferase [Chloroflexota bacterium]
MTETLPTRLAALVATVQPLDDAAMTAARLRQDQLTKPRGSLGRLEALAIQLAGITGQPLPRFPNKAVLVFAADHGVAQEGVSAYPQDVTTQMVLNFLNGGAAINVLARRAGARVVVADFGVATELPSHAELRVRRIRGGTSSFARGPAMARAEAVVCLEAGAALLADEAERGLDLVATGDMGIGNTTASSAIVAAITGAPVAQVTGFGTGIDAASWARKVEIIQQSLTALQPNPADPIDVLAKVGGFEIAGLSGAIIAAAGRRIPVVIDGFISGAAALVAAELCPAVKPYLIAAHTSVEIGHRVVLERLGLTPLLNLDLRLGEGTGAAMAMHLVDDAVALLAEMATFQSAGVSDREG